MEISEKFRQEIAPFCWSEYQGTASVCLDAGFYLQQVWEDGGFEGSGYDWEVLPEYFWKRSVRNLWENLILIQRPECFVRIQKTKKLCRSLSVLLEPPVRTRL